MSDVDARVERLLDQLERPDVSESEMERIKAKIAILRDQPS